MRNTLLILLVLILAVVVYRPILAMAGRDIAARSAAGKSNGIVYAILLLPLLGPFVYLLIRKRLLPEGEQ